MIQHFPFSRVNWVASSFLIVTFFVAVIGTPFYIWNFGLDAFQIGLFCFYFFATGLSITLGYHRLFAHKSFTASWPVRFFSLVFGACAFEDSALDWASDHRKHHKHTDHEKDPYNIQNGFFWAHMGWIFLKLYPRPLDNVQDLRRDSLVMWQHRHHRTIGLWVGLIAPFLLGWAIGGMQAAWGAFLLAGVTRVVAVQHCTFFINSMCHCIGARPYDSKTSARDSWLMALFTFGEGYHNYHHTFQHDYRNGVKWWQFDPTKWAIWTLERVGLVSGLRRVAQEKIVLAELREASKRAAVAIQAIEELDLASREDWPNWRSACEKVQELAEAVRMAYAELESSMSERVQVSQQYLRQARKQAAELLDHLSTLNQLQLGKGIRV